MDTAIVTQARMGSRRLPGKIMRAIAGRSLLDYHVERCSQVTCPLIVATTENERDEIIVNYCEGRDIPVLRGSETDLVRRYLSAATAFEVETVVRVTSDCPLLDPALIEFGIRTFRQGHWDFLSNTYPDPTFGVGFGFNIFSRSVLKDIDRRADDPAHREHLPRYIETHEDFVKYSVTAEEDNSHIRLTVDYPGDFIVMKKMIEGHQAHKMDHREIVGLYKRLFFT